ncbi:hypothetical protein CASFOL_032983 [Castilleja foliolosa]|uniref:Homeobox-leucine zipper protein n=1 Tax=Castilleja foliolosa TaxID=1961234 RepID=A0ABD3C5T8_9LAMI
MAFLPASAESIFRNHEDNLFPSSSPCAPQDFHGVPIPDFLMRRSMSFSGMDRAEEFQPDDDMSDDGSQMLGEKKRRLNHEQVKALEKSFESGNKLEPDRKMQLARALGLQPRQIAIWFQNRRARWKTKQLEKDYDVLKRQFEAIKADNDKLKSQNKKLQTQLMGLKNKESAGTGALINLNRDNESENSCEVNLNINSLTDNSTLYHQENKNGVVLPSSIGPDQHHHHHLQTCLKIAHQAPVTDDRFVFSGGIEESTEFWPWPEQQNYQ